MGDILNYEALVCVGLAAFVLAKLWEAVKDRLAFWPKLPDWGREVGGYVIMLANGVLMWSTGLDALPGFNGTWPVLGRVLTCVAGALGPSIVWDLWMDKPEPPPQ